MEAGEWSQASVLIAELKACGKKKDLTRGKHLHHAAVEAGVYANKYVATALITMYGKCGSMEEAQQVFKSMLQPNVVSWTALISAYVENGKNSAALETFHKMGFVPNSYTFVAALKACTALSKTSKSDCLHKGLALHLMAREHLLDKDIFVASTLVDLYGKAGDMARARAIFNDISQPDVVIWSALILGYVENGESEVALEMFARMDCSPNNVTLAGAIKACTSLASSRKLQRSVWLEKGVGIHKRAKDAGLVRDVMVANALMDMYSKCGDMKEARELFNGISCRNAVSWNTLMFGYLESAECERVLKLFDEMDVMPTSVTFVVVLKACGALAVTRRPERASCLQKGIKVHELAKEGGFEDDEFVTSSLVNMYSSCGDMRNARIVFDKTETKDVAMWSSLVCGYVENGESSIALDVFASMDCAPDKVTYLAVLKACARLGAFHCGMEAHRQICRLGFESDDTLANCLVDFYGKCGKVTAAEEVFSCISSPSMISWGALIGSYCLLGNTPQVFRLIDHMLASHVNCDSVSMLLVLSACSHAGMLVEAQRYFKSMTDIYGIVPNLGHYTCMINIMCRANKLEEALTMLKNMPFKANSPIWMILLVASEKWHNLHIAHVAFAALLSENDEEHVSTAYVLMRNIYEAQGKTKKDN